MADRVFPSSNNPPLLFPQPPSGGYFKQVNNSDPSYAEEKQKRKRERKRCAHVCPECKLHKKRCDGTQPYCLKGRHPNWVRDEDLSEDEFQPKCGACHNRKTRCTGSAPWCLYRHQVKSESESESDVHSMHHTAPPADTRCDECRARNLRCDGSFYWCLRNVQNAKPHKEAKVHHTAPPADTRCDECSARNIRCDGSFYWCLRNEDDTMEGSEEQSQQDRKPVSVSKPEPPHIRLYTGTPCDGCKLRNVFCNSAFYWCKRGPPCSRCTVMNLKCEGSHDLCLKSTAAIEVEDGPKCNECKTRKRTCNGTSVWCHKRKAALELNQLNIKIPLRPFEGLPPLPFFPGVPTESEEDPALMIGRCDWCIAVQKRCNGKHRRCARHVASEGEEETGQFQPASPPSPEQEKTRTTTRCAWCIRQRKRCDGSYAKCEKHVEGQEVVVQAPGPSKIRCDWCRTQKKRCDGSFPGCLKRNGVMLPSRAVILPNSEPQVEDSTTLEDNSCAACKQRNSKCDVSFLWCERRPAKAKPPAAVTTASQTKPRKREKMDPRCEACKRWKRKCNGSGYWCAYFKGTQGQTHEVDAEPTKETSGMSFRARFLLGGSGEPGGAINGNDE